MKTTCWSSSGSGSTSQFTRSGPSSGWVTVFTRCPGAWTGSQIFTADSFTYTDNDGIDDSESKTVNLEVTNTGPNGQDDAYSFTQGSRKLRITKPGQQSGRVQVRWRRSQGFDQQNLDQPRQHKRLPCSFLACLSFNELDDWRHAIDCRIGCANVQHLW